MLGIRWGVVADLAPRAAGPIPGCRGPRTRPPAGGGGETRGRESAIGSPIAIPVILILIAPVGGAARTRRPGPYAYRIRWRRTAYVAATNRAVPPPASGRGAVAVMGQPTTINVVAPHVGHTRVGRVANVDESSIPRV